MSDPIARRCPNCGASALSSFYQVRNDPVHCVTLIRTRAEALNFPTGDIDLALCRACGFITNIAFDPNRLDYASDYEETQGFSGTFNAFHKRLAEDLIRRYDLHGKRILEVGCGKGDFISLLCELGPNQGVAFDPAYVPERNTSTAKEAVHFIRDFYSEKYAGYTGDFFCCKMTLEHIPDPAAFVGMIRRSLDTQPGTTVFFQVPETMRILREFAFWDIYYEHCSYFTAGSLARLFHHQGFDVLDLWTAYDDQYLMIEARLRTGEPTSPLLPPNDLEEVERAVTTFAAHMEHRQASWQTALHRLRSHGQRVVLWGGGSKAVAFLNTLHLRAEVECAVDINPYKQGTYLAGTGHPVVGPDYLNAHPPDVVIIMNPVYHNEIVAELNARGLTPEILHIDTDPETLALA